VAPLTFKNNNAIFAVCYMLLDDRGYQQLVGLADYVSKANSVDFFCCRCAVVNQTPFY
jgi:hypothetical protein